MPPAATSSNTTPVRDHAWFREEVQPHDGPLRAYLRGSFPTVRDVDDVVQESYLRIWQAKTVEPIKSAKAFLFRVARNLAIDLVRQRRVASEEPAAELDRLATDESQDAAGAAVRQERVAMLAAALETLRPRHRFIVIECKLKGRSYREVALELGIAERTVAEHAYRGTQALGGELQRRGIMEFER